MNNLISNTISYTVSGFLVAALAYVFLSGEFISNDIEVEYNFVNYEGELADALVDDVKSILKDLNVDPDTNQLSATLYGFKSQSIFSHFGYIEETTIINRETNRSVDVQIEGVGINFAVIGSKSAGRVVQRANFKEEIRILPKEKVSILNIVDIRSQYGSVFEATASDTILVSVDGKYLRPLNRNTFLSDMFGNQMSAHPTIFFGILLFGAYSILRVILMLIISQNKRWDFRITDEFSEVKELAKYSILLSKIEEKEPDRWNKINARIKETEHLYFGD